MLIVGLGNPAVPEQMDAPEKSMPAADTGGGGTAFSEIMTRVSEEKGETPAVKEPETKAKQEKTVRKEEKQEEKNSDKGKVVEKNGDLTSLIAAGEGKPAEQPAEKPEVAFQQGEKAGLKEKVAVPSEPVNLRTTESAAQIQMAAMADESLSPKQGKQNGKSTDQDSKKEKAKLKIIDTRRKQVTADKGVDVEKPLTEESPRQRHFTVIEKDPGGGNEREVFKPSSSLATKNDQTTLFKHLQDTVNDKIVRQAGIILKDNSNGELRLVLKPEKMGTVRIRLELQDNHIAGKIFVDNSSVKDVFDQNLEALYRAFRESGYETSGLNVTVGNGNSGDADKQGRGIPKGTIKMLEDFVPLADEVIYADYLVNLIV